MRSKPGQEQDKDISEESRAWKKTWLKPEARRKRWSRPKRSRLRERDSPPSKRPGNVLPRGRSARDGTSLAADCSSGAYQYATVPRFTVTAATSTAETTVSAKSSGASASCTATSCTVDEGKTVTLTAESKNPGLQFVSWSGGSCADPKPVQTRTRESQRDGHRELRTRPAEQPARRHGLRVLRR